VADVLIVVGSESDKPRIEPAFEILSKAGVSYEFHVSSAHRQPDQTADLVVIDGNPAATIADIRHVTLVFKQGVGYDPVKLIESVRGKVGLF